MGIQAVELPIDSRQKRPRGETAIEFLRDFPALLALSRLPIPILAVDDRGRIEFVNDAFAAMVGRTPTEVMSTTAQSLVECDTQNHSGMVAALKDYANSVIRLRHAGGWTMPALVSESVLIREKETLAVVALTDLTEIAWHSAPDDGLGLS